MIRIRGNLRRTVFLRHKNNGGLTVNSCKTVYASRSAILNDLDRMRFVTNPFEHDFPI
jgi:hypothetical protein